MAIRWIGAGNGRGSHDLGTRDGARLALDELCFQQKDSWPPTSVASFSSLLIEECPQALPALSVLTDFNLRLAKATASTVRAGQFPFVIGGDHSCAIGTWSGVAKSLNSEIGLLWIDAHLDAHTFATTETGNIHGMPLAALLGHGDSSLTMIGGPHAKLAADRVVVFGARSYEDGEKALLDRLNVRVYEMNEIQRRGFTTCWTEALARVRQGSRFQNPGRYGISLDLDGFDPHLIPSVGTPVPGGLVPEEVLRHLWPYLSDSELVGLEVVEFNPHHDRGSQGLSLILELAALLRRQRPSQANRQPHCEFENQFSARTVRNSGLSLWPL